MKYKVTTTEMLYTTVVYEIEAKDQDELKKKLESIKCSGEEYVSHEHGLGNDEFIAFESVEEADGIVMNVDKLNEEIDNES